MFSPTRMFSLNVSWMLCSFQFENAENPFSCFRWKLTQFSFIGDVLVSTTYFRFSRVWNLYREGRKLILIEIICWCPSMTLSQKWEKVKTRRICAVSDNQKKFSSEKEFRWNSNIDENLMKRIYLRCGYEILCS